MTSCSQIHNRVLAYARTHYFCCKIWLGYILCLGVIFVVAGSVLIAIFREPSNCSRVINVNGTTVRRFPDGMTCINNNEYILRILGFVALTTGLVLLLIGITFAVYVCYARRSEKPKKQFPVGISANSAPQPPNHKTNFPSLNLRIPANFEEGAPSVP